jgi:hypothetical protein
MFNYRCRFIHQQQYSLRQSPQPCDLTVRSLGWMFKDAVQILLLEKRSDASLSMRLVRFKTMPGY